MLLYTFRYKGTAIFNLLAPLWHAKAYINGMVFVVMLKMKYGLPSMIFVFAALYFLPGCRHNNATIVAQSRLVDKIAGKRIWHGFTRVDSDTTIVAPFPDSIMAINDSTVQFTNYSSHMSTLPLVYYETDSITRCVSFYSKVDFVAIYYYYDRDSIHYLEAWSALHNGRNNYFTP